MQPFPWWTDEQKAFAEEVRAFVKEIAPRDAATRWTREFPFDIYKKIGAKGYIGAAIPKEYGGLGLGATGACILSEELHSMMPGIGRIVVGNMNGGLRQIIEYGTEEQKKRFLPDIAGGEIGAVVITEMTAGTDAAGVTVTAKKEGNHYILNGKKRFIVAAGVAERYFVYARTSDNPEDYKKRRHLTAFVVKKGTPGFTCEKLNEILAFENVQNGSLDFDNVVVSEADRIGQEGEGWKIMMAGLNFERTVIASGTIGWQRLLLNNAVPYAQRRVQFGKPTIDIPANQDKIADLVIRLKISRIAVYYTAWLWDREEDITIEASAIKAFGAEQTLESAKQATQIMAGDGVNRFYPVQNIYEVAKTEHVAGGTVEACRLVIFRSALKLMTEDIQMPRRVIDQELGVPVPAFGPVENKLPASEENVLAVLAEDYRINPGLHMTPGDIKEYIAAGDAELEKAIVALEGKGYVMVLRNKKGIQLVKATYDGLNKAYPKEHYRWFPTWATEDRVF
ncbi:Acyl-CoA dehydrogenase [Pelotomaculum sp. FP]|uniref:acyl-CoA dehydrogenase family protein n=1 Tax=Pelotomaculum sp. FP TaxID=261474 RepID=UPI0010669797|nr:acyl-CoA dehydrogenase family protein [Pelotomaculum sp. FP]TEB14724.1 Acyl-CoA dehydrogenase [Pelotomaculum sp. FP]